MRDRDDDKLPLPPPTEAEHGSRHLLDLVDRSRPSRPAIDLAEEMTTRFGRGDFNGALRAAELLLGKDPGNATARRYVEDSRVHLERAYAAKLGSYDRVLEVIISEREVRLLGLDPRATLLLGAIDGKRSIQDVLVSIGITRLEALRTVVELLDSGAVRFVPL